MPKRPKRAAFPIPSRYTRIFHGNLQKGSPLKPYDGLTSWTVVRWQVEMVRRFMSGVYR